MFGSPIRFRPARQEQMFNGLYSKQGEYTHFPRTSHGICAATYGDTTVGGMGEQRTARLTPQDPIAFQNRADGSQFRSDDAPP
jgi:hypothetical protein